MKVKLTLAQMVLLIFFSGLIVYPALSAETSYCPDSYSQIEVDGHSVMRIWGVSGVTPNHALSANPDYDWPTETSVALWYDAIVSAKASGTCVTLRYDIDSKTDSDGNTVHDLWSVFDLVFG